VRAGAAGWIGRDKEVSVRLRTWWVTAIIVVGCVGGVEAKATWVKKAQAEAPEIKSCLDCHTSAKVTVKDLKLNARGEFMTTKRNSVCAKTSAACATGLT
jgi:hypothetical protein